MSKNLLEELLIQAGTLNEETEKRVNKNQKVVIENTMASAVRNFIQEAVGEEELEVPEEELEGTKEELYTEEEVDSETGEALGSEEEEEDSDEEDYDSEEDEDYEEDSEEDDYSDEEDYDSEDEEEDYSDEDEDEDYSDEDEDYSDEDEDYSDEDDYDSEEDMYGDESTDFDDEEEVMDMTKADINDVIEFIENSDEDVVIQVVKQPTYNVKVSGGSKRMPSGMKSSMGDEEDVELEIDETVLMEMMKELKSEMKGMPMKEMKGMKPMKEMKKMKQEMKGMYDEGMDVESGDITLEIEGLDEEMKDIYEYEGLDEMELEPSQMTDPKTGKKYNLQAVAENRRLKNQLNKLIAENKKLKINETKSIAALKSMIEQTKQVALVNSNLAYVSRLFTEHSTTKQEKVAILKQFDSAKTLKESEMTFKILTESLSKRTQKKTLNVNINEAVDLNKQKVVKEEKAYVNDPEQEKILRLMDYKSTL